MQSIPVQKCTGSFADLHKCGTFYRPKCPGHVPQCTTIYVGGLSSITLLSTPWTDCRQGCAEHGARGNVRFLCAVRPVGGQLLLHGVHLVLARQGGGRYVVIPNVQRCAVTNMLRYTKFCSHCCWVVSGKGSLTSIPLNNATLHLAAAGACLYFIFYVPYFFIAPDRRYPTVSQGT